MKPLLTRDESHVYRLDGKPVPGVTSLLAQLHQFAGVPLEVLDAAAERGTAVHQACEFFDQDDLGDYDPAIGGYVRAWQNFVGDSRANWTGIELMGFHPLMLYAGQVDRTGTVFGKPKVLDIKTGMPHWCWGLQTAAYREMLGLRDHGRATVKLNADGTYRYLEWPDPADWPGFVALHTLHNLKVKHGNH